jgi:hypothetical protein
MKSVLLVVKNLTEANKAKYHLDKLAVKSVIEKISGKKTSSGGCGYGVRVWEDPERVCRLLNVVNIYCTEVVYN